LDQVRAEGGKAQEAFLACVVKHTPNPLKRFSLNYIADFLIKQKWKGLSSMWGTGAWPPPSCPWVICLSDNGPFPYLTCMDVHPMEPW
jgi:hypothetical protein